MTDYIQVTNFRRKDSLPTGDASKKVTGAELQSEFDAIATAIATKLDSSGLPATPASTTTQQTFTAGFGTTPINSSGATLDINCASSNVFAHTYAVPVTVNAPTNPVQGQRIYIKMINGVGVAAWTWNAVFKFVAGTSQPTQTNGAIDQAVAVYIGTVWLVSYMGKNYV